MNRNEEHASSNTKTKLVAYLRVSTNKQGSSGLGLLAQERAVVDYAASHGGKLLHVFTEIETGKRDDLKNRPELIKALALTKRTKATLVVAKLDRLSRSVAVTSALHVSGVDFIACDQPYANKMTIQFLSVVAENEAAAISVRTKEGLASAKARGTLLGAARPKARKLTRENGLFGAKRSAVARKERALNLYADLVPEVATMRAEGKSLREVAAVLNAKGFATARGGTWSATQVQRLAAMAS